MAPKGKNQGLKNPTEGIETQSNEDEKGFTFYEQKRTEAWYRPDSGEAVVGVLLGRRAKKVGGAYFQIHLTRQCSGVNADKETMVLEPGSIIGVDEKAGLAEVTAWCEEGRACVVYIKALEKVPLDGGKTFWRYKVGRRQPVGKEPNLKPTMIGRETPKTDEDTPF